MKKKYSAKIYRDAIEQLNFGYGFACNSLDRLDLTAETSSRFSKFLVGNYSESWTLTNEYPGGPDQEEYRAETDLGRLTREIALELAAHLEETG